MTFVSTLGWMARAARIDGGEKNFEKIDGAVTGVSAEGVAK